MSLAARVRWMSVLLASCFFLSAHFPSRAAQKPVGGIDKWIERLGDDEFSRREEASRHLEKLGEAALKALRKAAKEHASAEVRSRAAELVRQIEKELRGELLAFGNEAGYWLNRVAFTPDGRQAVATGGAVILYDLATGKELRRSHELNFARLGLALSRDGKYFVTGHQFDNAVRMGEVQTGTEVKSFVGHTGGVFAVALSPDGTRIASGGLDKTLRLWDVKTAKELRQFPGIKDMIRSVDFSADSRRLVSGHSGANDTPYLVRLWDVDTGKEVAAFKAHTGEVNAVRLLPDGTSLLSAGMDGALIIWDIKTGKEVRRMKHDGGVYSAAVSPDGRRALTAGFGDRTVRLWDLATGREVRRLDGHPGAVLGVAFSPDGARALSCDSRCTLRLWRLPGERKR
jgi:WD40 repeat protein